MALSVGIRHDVPKDITERAYEGRERHDKGSREMHFVGLAINITSRNAN